jgi:hypothetical protein
MGARQLLFFAVLPAVILGIHNDAVPTYFHRLHPGTGAAVDRFGPEFHVPGYTVFKSKASAFESEVASPKLACYPDVVHSGGETHVSWSGVTEPSPLDWVGFFCPTTHADDKYVDYFFPGASGYGSANFTLTDTRNDCNFRYFQPAASAVSGSWSRVAVSNTVSFATGSPLHAHLALTSSPGKELAP